MRPNASFRWNLVLIALAHVGVIVGVVRLARTPQPVAQSIMWMTADAGAATGQQTDASRIHVPPATADETAERKTEDASAAAPDLKSDMQLPTATPTATAAPTATATPRPKPSASAPVKPKTTPQPAPRKRITPKASPKSKAEPRHTPPPKDVDVTATSAPDSPKGSDAAASSADSGGVSGATTKAVAASYGRMLHDRLYSEWNQPTGLQQGARFTAGVKLRIERDGRISEFRVVRSSGNVIVDESIDAIGKRVTQVDPLPKELGGGKAYDLTINFELNADE